MGSYWYVLQGNDSSGREWPATFRSSPSMHKWHMSKQNNTHLYSRKEIKKAKMYAHVKYLISRSNKKPVMWLFGTVMYLVTLQYQKKAGQILCRQMSLQKPSVQSVLQLKPKCYEGEHPTRRREQWSQISVTWPIRARQNQPWPYNHQHQWNTVDFVFGKTCVWRKEHTESTNILCNFNF